MVRIAALEMNVIDYPRPDGACPLVRPRATGCRRPGRYHCLGYSGGQPFSTGQRPRNRTDKPNFLAAG